MTNGRTILILVFVLALHLFFLINTKFTLWPEMVVYPYLINNGFNLYTDIINPYPPLFLGFLALFGKIFGYQPLAYQVLTWAIILFVDLIIYLIVRTIAGKKEALLSCLFFSVISIPFGINGLWFDLVQVPLILASVYFLTEFLNSPLNRKKLFFSIFLLTIAFFIKQQVVWLLPVYGFLIFKNKIKISSGEFLILLFPAAALLLVQVTAFALKGTISDYLFWTTYFPYVLASGMPGYILLPSTRQLALVASLYVLFTPLFASKRITTAIFMPSIALILFAYPRFDYFHLIPALGLLSLSFGANIKAFASAKIPVKLISLAAASLLIFQTVRYLYGNLTKEVRFFEPEIFQSADFVKRATTKDQKIYIQNGPDQLLALAQRLPPKPWADEFPWYLEIEGLQGRIVYGLLEEDPKFIVAKPYEPGKTYQIGAYKPELINKYIELNYKNFFQISPNLWLKIKK